MTDVIKEVNQLDLSPATEDDFKYLIKYKHGVNNWSPIVLRDETYTCVWWDCRNLTVSENRDIEDYEIIRNPNYKGNPA